MTDKATRSRITTQGTKTGVLCRCGVFTPFGGYAIAQMSKENAVRISCPCGNNISVKKAGASYQITEVA